MRSARAKILHQLLGRPLFSYPMDRANELRAAPVIAVLGHQKAEVQAALAARYGADKVRVVVQAEQRGTGHALRLAMPALKGFQGFVLVLYGDVPLLRRETLADLVARSRRTGSLAVLIARAPDPTGYGRIVRDGAGNVVKVVEHKDASAEVRAINEVNAGIYAAPADFLRKATAGLSAKNAQGEYYLTDIIERAARSIGVVTVQGSWTEVSGVNDRRQLAELEAALRERINRDWMERGVTMRDPAGTVIEPDVELAADVELGRSVALRGKTVVGAGTRIGDGCLLDNADVGQAVEIKPYCVVTDSVIGGGAKLGPFAHLRPGSVLGEDAHVGNFVETKKTRLGRGSKANHLTYLGDAIIGAGVNVGAGTITCNYNGFEKLPTVIEDGAFIGSDTQLVAPVKVGKRAVVAAGTTVTEDVPAGALAISRVAQESRLGYADRIAQRYAKRDRPPARKSKDPARSRR